MTPAEVWGGHRFAEPVAVGPTPGAPRYGPPVPSGTTGR